MFLWFHGGFTEVSSGATPGLLEVHQIPLPSHMDSTIKPLESTIKSYVSPKNNDNVVFILSNN